MSKIWIRLRNTDRDTATTVSVFFQKAGILFQSTRVRQSNVLRRGIIDHPRRTSIRVTRYLAFIWEKANLDSRGSLRRGEYDVRTTHDVRTIPT